MIMKDSPEYLKTGSTSKGWGPFKYGNNMEMNILVEEKNRGGV